MSVVAANCEHLSLHCEKDQLRLVQLGFQIRRNPIPEGSVRLVHAGEHQMRYIEDIPHLAQLALYSRTENALLVLPLLNKSPHIV